MEQSIEEYGKKMNSALPNQNAYDWETYFRSACTPNGIRILNNGSQVVLHVLGHYGTVGELPTDARVGDIYSVGTEEPYEFYAYSSNGTWYSIGKIQGPAGPQGPKGDTGPKGATGATGVGVKSISITEV